MRTTISAFVFGILAAFATTATAAEWNMATPYPDATFHTQNIQEFVKDVEKATDGSLSIQVHPAGSLIKHPQIKRGVQTQQVQAGETFISLLGNEDPIFTVDSIPFLATSYDQARDLWAASRPHIEDRLAEDGIKLLYAVPWPAQGLYVSQEVQSVDDLKGILSEQGLEKDGCRPRSRCRRSRRRSPPASSRA